MVLATCNGLCPQMDGIQIFRHADQKARPGYHAYTPNEAFGRETLLKNHMENKLKSEPKTQNAEKSNSEPNIPECSLCDDTFT